MNPDTEIRIQWPDSGDEVKTTWAEFAHSNPDDAAEVEAQIAEDHYAEIGGGAAPLVWVLA